MDYSSNMNIIVTVISIIINSMGGVDYYWFARQPVSHLWRKRKGGGRVEGGKFVVRGEVHKKKKGFDNSHEELW